MPVVFQKSMDDIVDVIVDDIVEGPLMNISCGGFLSLIQHRPSPEAS